MLDEITNNQSVKVKSNKFETNLVGKKANIIKDTIYESDNEYRRTSYGRQKSYVGESGMIVAVDENGFKIYIALENGIQYFYPQI